MTLTFRNSQREMRPEDKLIDMNHSFSVCPAGIMGSCLVAQDCPSATEQTLRRMAGPSHSPRPWQASEMLKGLVFLFLSSNLKFIMFNL